VLQIGKNKQLRACQGGCVSRGAGCAAFNSPAIYTSIEKTFREGFIYYH